MASGKTIKELMVDVFDFPHIPYWFSVRQAIGLFRVTMRKEEKAAQPSGILVFDEKYSLLGTLSIADIMRGIEPRFLRPSSGEAQVLDEDTSLLATLWDSKESRELAEKPVSEVMTRATLFVGPDDPMTRAAYLMIHSDLTLVPVLNDAKKLVGIVRLSEVFQELADAIF
jgi:Mg/Co/Ni transporter MgtE